MKMFISWSGQASHVVAEALKEWLPNVFQALNAEDVFLSSSDVAVGTTWFHELGTVLEDCDFGILCLTRENVRAPWVLFEAGAIAKRLASARVAPLLIGLTRDEVPSPLSQFQGAVLDRQGAAKLLESINEQLGDDKLTSSIRRGTLATDPRRRCSTSSSSGTTRNSSTCVRPHAVHYRSRSRRNSRHI